MLNQYFYIYILNYKIKKLRNQEKELKKSKKLSFFDEGKKIKHITI